MKHSNSYRGENIFRAIGTRRKTYSKKFEIEFDLYFDLCWRAEIIQVCLIMHLYVDIGVASSSLWGSMNTLITKLMSLSRHRYTPPFCACAASPNHQNYQKKYLSKNAASVRMWSDASVPVWSEEGVRSQVEKRVFDFLQTFLFCSDASVPVWSEQVCGNL